MHFCNSSGNNDNPTVTQFTSALRKLLIHNEIMSSDFANCADKLKIMTVSSRRQVQIQDQNSFSTFSLSCEEEQREANEESFIMPNIDENDMLLNCCEEITIAYMAGLLEKKILQHGRFECSCNAVLLRNEKVTDLSVSENTPCTSTLYICKIACACFNKSRNQIYFDYEMLIENIMQKIDYENIFNEFFECDIDHKAGFVKYIVQEYIRLQATYIAKNITLVEQKVLCRKKLNKVIHFLGL